MTTIINGSSPSITFSDGSAQTSATRPFQNRIINGAMVIDQRNAGASVTADGSYPVDRWILGVTQASKLTAQQNAGSVTPPAGFSNYLGFTSSSAYTVSASDYFITQQRIEGFNTADLGWGTANAKTVTVSFWVRSSLTGTFGGTIANGSFNRSYPFSYTISSANTWEQKSVTIAGDTSGTWVGATNGIGMILYLSMGAGSTYSGTANTWQAGIYLQPTGATSVVGTNGATFYITGVQLEVGSTATSFDYRPYGTELALCQRYYNNVILGDSVGILGFNDSSTKTLNIYTYPVQMRTSPTLVTTGTASNYRIRIAGGTVTCSAVPAFGGSNEQNNTLCRINTTVASGLTTGQGSYLDSNSGNVNIAFSAEL